MADAIQHVINGLGQVPAPAIYAFIVVWLAAESCGLPLPNELVLLAAGSLCVWRVLGGLSVAAKAAGRGWSAIRGGNPRAERARAVTPGSQVRRCSPHGRRRKFCGVALRRGLQPPLLGSSRRTRRCSTA